MQTFLPYADFAASAVVLDSRRLGKQRVEAMQILRALEGITKGWRNHPATKMWEHYPQALAAYGRAMCREWQARGFNSTIHEFFEEREHAAPELPSWLGHEAFHSAHRAALLAKDPAHYARFGWTERPSISYLWPTKDRT